VGSGRKRKKNLEKWYVKPDRGKKKVGKDKKPRHKHRARPNVTKSAGRVVPALKALLEEGRKGVPQSQKPKAYERNRHAVNNQRVYSESSLRTPMKEN